MESHREEGTRMESHREEGTRRQGDEDGIERRGQEGEDEFART